MKKTIALWRLRIGNSRKKKEIQLSSLAEYARRCKPLENGRATPTASCCITKVCDQRNKYSSSSQLHRVQPTDTKLALM